MWIHSSGGSFTATGLTVRSLDDYLFREVGDMTIKKMESAAKTIKIFLEMVPGIQYAFIYGPFRKRPKNSEGEVDVMVVGGPDLAEMDQIVSKAEEELRRDISLTSFKVREFRGRAKVRDGLVAKALSRPRIMLIGIEKEMAGLLA